MKDQERSIQVHMLTEYSTSTTQLTRLILSIVPSFTSSNNRCIDGGWVKSGGRSPDNDLCKDGDQYLHRIMSTNVSINTVQSLTQRDSYLACVVVWLFW